MGALEASLDARGGPRAIESKRTEDLVQLHDGGIGTDAMNGLRRRNAILKDILILGRGPVVGHGDSIDREGRDIVVKSRTEEAVESFSCVVR